jgi:hypothetical protein
MDSKILNKTKIVDKKYSMVIIYGNSIDFCKAL